MLSNDKINVPVTRPVFLDWWPRIVMMWLANSLAKIHSFGFLGDDGVE